MTRSVDFEARNPLGTVLFTSSDPVLVGAWAEKNSEVHPEIWIEKVTRTETRQVIASPRLSVVGRAA